jgi:hypothetical protein
VFDLQPVRQFIYGLALCFLAAFLAVGAKAAWAASGSGAPSDLSSVKLCPAGVKEIEGSLPATPKPSVDPLHAADAIFEIQVQLTSAQSPSWHARPDHLGHVVDQLFFSPAVFFRPPPAL